MLRQVLRFFRKRRRDADLAIEIESYVEIETAANIERGMTEADARSAAIRKFGNRARCREEEWDMNTVQFADTLRRHLIFGARQLRRSPGFAITAILSLGIGIGANTAVFQLLDAIRMRSLPVANPAELVQVNIDGGTHGFGSSAGHFEATYPLWEQIRAHQEAFSGAFAWGATFWGYGPGQERDIRAIYGAGAMFATLGVHAYRGRLFDETDDRKGCPAEAAVLSYAMWQREFGARNEALGSKIVINGKPMRIVGVTPPEFFGLEVGRGFDIAAPNCVRAQWSNILERRHVWSMNVIGRLKPGWTVARASEYLKTASPAWFAQVRPTGYDSKSLQQWERFRLTAEPGGAGVSELRTEYERSLWLLLGITGLVLLLACANLANLLLARASGREREVAVRLAIGASRGQIAGQFLTESLLLALCGATVAVALAQLLSRSLVRFLSTKQTAVLLNLAPDWRVAAFIALAALATCILFGLAPALRSARANVSAAMKSGGRSATGARGQFRLQRAIIVAQVAFSLVLVSGAFLFVQSFRNLIGLDTGFKRDGIVFNFISFGALKPSRDQVRPMQHEMLDRIRAIPGIDAATTTTHMPLSGSSWTLAVQTPEGQRFGPQFTWVSPQYLKTMQIPLIAGREIEDRDTAQSEHVLMVNTAFVKKIFGGADPLGRTVHSLAEPGFPDDIYRVVGVVGDTRYSDIRKEPPPIAYAPELQNPQFGPGMAVVSRSSLPPAQSIAGIRSVVTRTWPAASIEQVELNAMLQDRLLRERMLAWVSGFFGILALALATLGLYGVISHVAARRRAEIGIRLALGATRGGVVGLFSRDALRMLAIGLAVGTLGALLSMRGARSLLFGIQPGDPWTILLPAVALAVTGVAAAALPAFRATRRGPAESLRNE